MPGVTGTLEFTLGFADVFMFGFILEFRLPLEFMFGFTLCQPLVETEPHPTVPYPTFCPCVCPWPWPCYVPH